VRQRPLAAVLRDYTPGLLRIRGVVGTGEGRDRGRQVLLVLVRSDSARIARRLPRTIEGYAVRVRVVGAVRANPGR